MRSGLQGEWVVTEVPPMRIVSDELWARVKERQLTTLENFSRTTTHRLSGADPPRYLLSGMLECAPYAIMARDRYGYTNHKKHMPIDGLNGACCSNQKTIPCKNLEDWGLSCLPAAFFGKGLFSDVAGQARQNLAASVRNEPDERQRISEDGRLPNRNSVKSSSRSAIARSRAGLGARLNQAPTEDRARIATP